MVKPQGLTGTELLTQRPIVLQRRNHCTGLSHFCQLDRRKDKSFILSTV